MNYNANKQQKPRKNGKQNIKRAIKKEVQREAKKYVKKDTRKERQAVVRSNSTKAARIGGRNQSYNSRRTNYRNGFQDFRQLAARNALSMKEPTFRYINMMIDPFGTTTATVRPDKMSRPTLVMKDYTENVQLNVTALATDLTVSNTLGGVVLWLSYGQNNFSLQYDDGDEESTPYWTIGHMALNADLKMCRNNNSKVGITPTQNYETITALMETARLGSAGLRLTPTVEVITNSDTPAVRQYIGNCFPLNDLYSKCYPTEVDYVSPLEALLSYMDAQQFTNAEGCTLRFNVLQEPMDKMMTGLQLQSEDWTFGTILSPVVIVLFNQGIVGTPSVDLSYYTYTLPIYMDSVWWFENQVNVPSPLLMTPSFVDVNWEMFETIIAALSNGGSTVLPCVVKGHTFKSFDKVFGKFMNQASKFLQFGSAALGPIQEIRNISGNVYNRKYKNDLMYY